MQRKDLLILLADRTGLLRGNILNVGDGLRMGISNEHIHVNCHIIESMLSSFGPVNNGNFLPGYWNTNIFQHIPICLNCFLGLILQFDELRENPLLFAKVKGQRGTSGLHVKWHLTINSFCMRGKKR